MRNIIISVKNLNKNYFMKGKIIEALKDVSFNIYEGELVAIVGDSGSGKSTLMNILGCLDTADSGDYFLDSYNVADFSENDLSKIRNEMIGFIFQSFNLIGSLTALENVELPLIYRKIKKGERRKIAKESLKKVGLSDRENHTPAELSGGQRQRVAVARAMGINPKIIFADEPTGNLDVKSRDDVIKVLQDFNNMGKTVIIITHDREVADLCDRKIHIKSGRIV